MCSIGPRGSVCQHNHGSQTKNKLCRAKSFSNISSQNISKTYPLNFDNLSALLVISTHFIASCPMRVLNKAPQSLRHGNGGNQITSPPNQQPLIFRTHKTMQSIFTRYSANTSESVCIGINPPTSPFCFPPFSFAFPFSDTHTRNKKKTTPRLDANEQHVDFY